MSVDPKAHWYPNKTPFNFSGNNPLNILDPNGMWEEKPDGSWTAQKGDSWWSLHEQSGMSWKETMAYAKQYNDGRGESNWKFVGVGDNVMTLSAVESYDYQHRGSLSSHEVYETALNDYAERFLESTSYSIANDDTNKNDPNGSLTGLAIGMMVQGELLNIATRSKHATKAAKYLGIRATVIGVGISIVQVNEIINNPSLSQGQKLSEGISKGFGAVPLYGIFWTAGWETGRYITERPWYQEKIHGKRNPNKSYILDGK